MTADRLVDFIPSTLSQFSPSRRLPTHTDSIGLCQWINERTQKNKPQVTASPLADFWPASPTVAATDYTLARAPRVDTLILPTSTPVLFCNQRGTAASGADNQTIPPLAQSVKVAGHVLACNGKLVFDRTDFELPGPIPFSWQRFYRQGENRDCGLGRGWRHTLSEVLELPEVSENRQALLLHTAEGRRICFDLPPIGHGIFNRCEKLLLIRQSLHSFRLCGFNTPDKVFRADGNSGQARLNEIRDFFGNTLTIDYRDGQPQKIVTSWGRTLLFHYQQGNDADHEKPARLQAISHSPSPDEAQKICRYEFEHDTDNESLASEGIAGKKVNGDKVDGENIDTEHASATVRLISSSTGERHENYQYQQGELIAIQRRCGERWQFSYDRQQRCHHIQHNQRSIQLRWQQARQRCTQTVAGEHPIAWQFDGRNNLLRQRQGGREHRYLYDHYNNCCARIAPDGQRDLYRHDELGRLTRHTINGVHHRFLFDDLGRLRGALISDDQVSGGRVSGGRVSGGQVSGGQASIDSTWCFNYDDHPHPVAITDPRGHRWHCEYDERGQLRLITDPEAGQIALQWDALAQLQSISLVERRWQFDYDHLHRLTRCTNPEGIEEHWQYHSDGKLQHAQLGGTTYTLGYDEAQRPCRLDADGDGYLQWHCDDYGRIRQVTAPAESTSAQNRPQPLQWQITYNASGRIAQLSISQPTGSQPTVSQPTMGEQRFHWHYDEFAQVSLLTDSSGREEEWQYDRCGRIIEYRDCDNHWYLHYSNQGGLEKIRNNSGQQCVFHFDYHGRLTQAANSHSSLRFRYDQAGLLTAEHHDLREGDNLSINHQYDSRGWLKTSGSDCLNITALLSPDANLFGLDANGDALLRGERRGNEGIWNLSNLSLVRTFNQARLSGVSWGSAAEESLTFAPVRPALPTPFQLLRNSAETQRDRRGYMEREIRLGNGVNRAQVPEKTLESYHTYHYQFDGWGLLSSAECGDFKTYFRYDPFGRRLWKISTHRRSARQRKVLTHWWSQGLWSATTFLDERQSRTHYLHHPQLGTPLARLREGTTEYFITDGDGTVQGLADTEGTVFWLATSEGTQCPDEYRGYSGIFDSETRLLYRQFRYWHPGLNTYLDAPAMSLRWDDLPASTNTQSSAESVDKAENALETRPVPLAAL